MDFKGTIYETMILSTSVPSIVLSKSSGCNFTSFLHSASQDDRDLNGMRHQYEEKILRNAFVR